MSRTRIIGGKLTKIVEGDYQLFSEGNIVYNSQSEVVFEGKENGMVFGNPETLKNDSEDFHVTFSLNKEDRTIVPMGILDFDNDFENPFFVFNYSLSVANLDSLEFHIYDEDGKAIYVMINYAPIVVKAMKKPMLFKELKASTPPKDSANPLKSFDIKSILEKFAHPDLTQPGSYVITWDGFSTEGIYDSTIFNDKKLKAKLIAKKGGKVKTEEVEFETKYKEVDWVDIKIDKNKKRVDIALRVDLKDGGAEGLNCITNSESNTTIEGDSNPFKGINVTLCDWDKIPSKEIQPNKPIIKTRTRSFSDLERLALEGLKYHWGRNNNHSVAKNVTIGSETYEVFINPINTTENAMDDVSLVFNTNNGWMRSGNPGSANINPISWFGNLVSREAVCYNVGHIKYSEGWGYQSENNEDIHFKETSAHEIGHEILKSYGGTNYSYGHKGTVNVVTQSSNSNAIANPTSGEIDLMPYYTDWLDYNQRNRIAASEKDVLSLIWLTKIKIK